MADERVERKLAAILAADVVGYWRLMEADEEGTRARLKPQYGRANHKTTGDALRVELTNA